MALYTGGFGSAQRLPLRDFVMLGLITGWVYTALRLAQAIGEHFDRRWNDVEARAELRGTDPRFFALRRTGFSTSAAAVWAAVALFGLAVALAGWSTYKGALVTGGVAAALFYAGALLLIYWTLNNIRRHETLELIVRERGAGALLEYPDLGDEIARRRERQNNHVVAFLVLAVPMLLSPLVVPAIVAISLLAAFHVWGTALLVSFFNGHLSEERRHAFTAPAGDGLPDAEANPQRARVAIMLTDMQDYSKAMGADEKGAYARLVEHNRMMRAAIAAHRGREIKTMGDAFLVVFRSAVNAVECALAAQRAFADYNKSRREKERIIVRIGLHLGEVILTGTDVFGDDVNIVARLEPLAPPGGICLSEPVLKIARRKVKLEVEPVEGATLKNIASPPPLFRIAAAPGS